MAVVYTRIPSVPVTTRRIQAVSIQLLCFCINSTRWMKAKSERSYQHIMSSVGDGHPTVGMMFWEDEHVPMTHQLTQGAGFGVRGTPSVVED